MKDCNGGDDFDWLSQQAQQVKVLQQRQQLQQQLNKILSKDEKLEQLRKCKEKVAILYEITNRCSYMQSILFHC